jgi:hypothetical protein
MISLSIPKTTITKLYHLYNDILCLNTVTEHHQFEDAFKEINFDNYIYDLAFKLTAAKLDSRNNVLGTEELKNMFNSISELLKAHVELKPERRGGITK